MDIKLCFYAAEHRHHNAIPTNNPSQNEYILLMVVLWTSELFIDEVWDM